MVSLEWTLATDSEVRVVAVVRKLEIGLLPLIRRLRAIRRRLAHAISEAEVAHLHATPLAPIAEEFGEVALEEHPPARQSIERVHAAEIDHGGGNAGVGQQSLGHPVPWHALHCLAPVTPRSIVE